MFSPGRSWEQVRTTIAYNNVNVKIIGAHSGISVGPDGATHQALEDIALMRVVPNMIVVAPCDALEAERATHALAEYVGPAYMRLAREKTAVITTSKTPFIIGKAEVYMEKVDAPHGVAIIASGTVLVEALRAGKILNEKGIGATVVNMATIKPLDEAMVLSLAKTHDFIVTVEEHQTAGGMGSAVAEFLSETHPIKVVRLGVHDMFGQSGTQEELLAHYNLDAAAIVKTILTELVDF